jgi:hypothetical protein
MASSIVPQLAANSPPPPDYYAENLRQLITHVHAHYGDVLRREEIGYGRRIVACSVPAQRLYARLLSRRGPWIRIDKLRYREVRSATAGHRPTRCSVCSLRRKDVSSLPPLAMRRRLAGSTNA